MSIQRSPSILNLDIAALNVDRENHNAHDANETLEESAERFGRAVELSFAFSQAFAKALEHHTERELKEHLLTILPRGHKIPVYF